MPDVGPAEGDGKGRALVHFRFGPHPAAVALRDPLDEGEAGALALELVGAVEPLEQAEQLAGIAPS